MNKYRVSVQLTIYKDVEVEASNSDEAEDKVNSMGDDELTFTENDDCGDGMSITGTELLDGVEPFNWGNVGQTEYNRIRMFIANQLPAEELSEKRVEGVLRTIIEVTPDADVPQLLSDNMFLAEVVGLNLND